MTFIEDIAAAFQDRRFAGDGLDWFLSQNAMPPTPDQAIAITPIPGRIDSTMDRVVVDERPQALIRIRSSSLVKAQAKAEEIRQVMYFTSLCSEHNGPWFVDIAFTDPDRDKNERWVLSASVWGFRVVRREQR